MQADSRSEPIARRRFFRQFDKTPRGPRINDRIRISPVRLIDEDDKMIGIIETEEALRRAREAGLDLVEVAANASPPVCKITDYGRWKYEQSKKDKATKSKTKTSELKEVRLGRSMKIDPHDIQIRLDQARKFLIEGHKVQIVQNFRGREMLHRDRGQQRMQDIVEQLSDVAKMEVAPRQMGRRMTMILAPDRAKIEQVLRRDGARQGPPAADDASEAETDAGDATEADEAQLEAAAGRSSPDRG